MATLLPSQMVKGKSMAYARLLRLCKALPETYVIRQRMNPGEGADLLVICGSRAAHLLVFDLQPRDIETFRQSSLFGEAPERLAQLHARWERGPEPFLAVLPLLSAEQCRFLDLPDRPVVTQEAMRAEPFKALLDGALVTLDEAALVDLRQRFSPELVLPEALTVRPRREDTDAGSTTKLLDVDQEHVLKVDLNLDPSGHTLSRAFNVRLVTGGAGCGKSLVILYRLRLLRQLYAGKPRRMIVLTHNPSLVQDMEQHYNHLSDGDTGVEWWCFLSWCREHWPANIPFDPISLADRSAIAETLINEHLPGSSISPDMLLSEIDWCKDSLFTTREEYLEADRSSRAFGLRERTREQVYAAIEGYQQELRKAGRIDWSEVPRTLWREVQNGKVEVPVYDAIFVDEAQFFAPFWFQILQHCLKETTGHLFVAADPTQGFLKRRQTWIGLGLDVRGRSHRLETSYRANRAMLDLANLLYRHRTANDPEAPLPPDLNHLGVMPMVIPIATAQNETTRVIEEIEALLARGQAPEQLLLIMADSFGVQPMLDRLENQLGKDTAYDPQCHPAGKGIRVCSLEASANQEGPIVFVCGTHQLYQREQGLRLSAEEHVALVHGHTRSLYRALTRAEKGLIIMHVGELPGMSSPDWDIKRSD